MAKSAHHSKQIKSSILISNNKAFYNYQIIEDFMAGIILTGAEVKSLRLGHANLKGSFITVKIEDGKYYLYLHNLMINPYQKHILDTNSRRKRILLLNSKEIKQLYHQSMAKGSSIVPLSIEVHHNLIKVKIALAKGKKKYDKRQVLKDRAINRDIKQDIKKHISI